jgi:hypothetical protein
MIIRLNKLRSIIGTYIFISATFGFALGYERLSVDDPVSMRIHGATPEFIKEFKSLGFSDIPADDLMSMRIHGVSIDDVKKMKARFHNVSVDDLVEMKIHGRS